MKFFWWMVVLMLGVSLAPVRAFLFDAEVLPGRDSGSTNFQIVSRSLPSGDVEFTVKVRDDALLRPRRSPLDLLTPVPGTRLEISKPAAKGWSWQTVRALPSEVEGKTVTCIFVMTRDELKDPHLVFAINNLVLIGSGGHYFRPQKFLPR